MTLQRCVYLTGGTVGAGHLVRGLAIQKALQRAALPTQLEIWGPAVPFPCLRSVPYRSITIEPRLLGDPVSAPTSVLGHALIQAAPELLIVDLFWVLVRFILPHLPSIAWLLVRRCPDLWFKGPPGIPFEPAQYQRVIAIEPDLSVPALTEEIDPVVICNRDELRPPDDLRELLGVRERQPLRVALQAGLPGEAAALASREYRVLDLFDERAPFPVAPWLSGADSIRTGAGYNAFWEARWLGHYPRTGFVAFPRGIDDQAWRMEHGASFTPRENGADTLARMISACQPRR